MCDGDNEGDRTVGDHFSGCVAQLTRNWKPDTATCTPFIQPLIVSNTVIQFMYLCVVGRFSILNTDKTKSVLISDRLVVCFGLAVLSVMYKCAFTL